MSAWTNWTWSHPHGRHYMYLIAEDGTILDTLWSGPAAPSSANSAPATRGGRASRSSSSTHGRQAASHRSQRQRAAPQPVVEGEGQEEEEGNEDDDDEDKEGDNDDDDDEGEGEGEDATGGSSNPDPRRGRDSGIGLAESLQRMQLASSGSSTSRALGSSQVHSPQFGYTTSPSTQSAQPARNDSRSTVASLPVDIQAQLKNLERRFIKTEPTLEQTERLDIRYRRVAAHHHYFFFIPGRVFKMLWSEPAGNANPGQTRNSTHFSTVWLGETAFSEIRHFVVVRNKGVFSQCIPIQTYGGRGAAKQGLIMADHGIIHTTRDAPHQLTGERLTKYSIRVESSGSETLLPASRVNYGKAYAVEHNVKLLDIGMVTEGHRYLLAAYFDAAMRGE